MSLHLIELVFISGHVKPYISAVGALARLHLHTAADGY